MLIVWSSFFILPYTSRCRVVHAEEEAYLLQDIAKVQRYEKRQKGGRLPGMFWYDTGCICLVVVLGLVAWGPLAQEGWQLRTTLYWLRVVYGLLSLPFVLFKLPVLNSLLTQVQSTGYDQQGKVVLSVKSKFVPPKED